MKDFLGDAKLKSLQSDGYICYMYLDDDLIDIEHLCCLAHVRAKLERAERMGCKEASSPMNHIRKLYKREDLYVEKVMMPKRSRRCAMMSILKVS